MKRTALLIASLWLGVGASSAQAQLFFNPFRKAAPAVPPAERVNQLIATIKSDPDENKRANAVIDLRDFDAKSFPQIVDALADVAQTDSKASVRAEAVSGLVRIRPVSATAGQAIEYVSQKDEHWRNRMNAQAALVRYRLAGYSSSTPPTPQNPTAKNQSPEPPLNTQPSVANSPGAPAPIIYHDQFGKVIPTPKGMPATAVPGSYPPGKVNGTPASNPVGRSPFAPIPSSAPQTGYQQPRPTAAPPAPVSIAPPMPIQPAPVALEPEFRNVAPPLTVTPPAPLNLNPAPVVAPSAIPAPAPTLAPPQPVGPSLDLPPLPINSTPAPVSPVSPPSGAGPSLGGSPPPSLQPSGRMEPSPRLSPATN